VTFVSFKVNRRKARQGELRSKRRSPGGEVALGQVVGSVTLTPGDRFQEAVFTGSIEHIEFADNASEGCVSCMNSIDDFGFSPVTTSDRADPVIDFGGTVGGFWRKLNVGGWT
jgi:hypothetical protein